MNSHWAIHKGYWKVAGIWPIKLILSGHKILHWLVVMNTLEMRPSTNRREDRITQQLLAEIWQLRSIFHEVPRFCLHLLKSKGGVEMLKNL
jgi:hypothetical protein